jgi:hypothetical protein
MVMISGLGPEGSGFDSQHSPKLHLGYVIILNVVRTNYIAAMAEFWSKAIELGSIPERGVGSNPTRCKNNFY